MPLNLTWAERQIFLSRAFGPGPLLDMISALGFRAVSAAVRLGLFEVLESAGPQTAGDAAARIGADERGVGILLRMLHGLGYVRRTGKSRYANSRMTRAWMLSASPVNCSAMMGFFEDAWDRWGRLDESIRTGMPAENCDEWLNRHPGSWERYHANLATVAQLVAPEIVAKLPLQPGAKRIIDIGGGSGLYSIRLCKKHEGLCSVIFDWPQARPAAKKAIAAAGMAQRVTFVEGDFFADDIGNGYDAALLFNVIRIYPEKDAMALLAKTLGAVRPGGMAFVADQFNSSTPTRFSEANAFLVLLELYNGTVGKGYSVDQIKHMLAGAGFQKAKEIRLHRAAGMGVVAARRGS